MILLVARSYPPLVGGIEKYMANLYGRIERNCDVSTLWHKSAHEYDSLDRCSVTRTPSWTNIFIRKKLALLPLFLQSLIMAARKPYSQFHCEQIQSGIIGLVLGTLFRKPYIVYAYGMEVSGGGSKWLKRMVFRRAARIVTISEFTREQLINRMHVDPEQIVKITPGVDTSYFKPEKSATERSNFSGRRVVLTVGRVVGGTRNKGHDKVIEAIPLLLERFPTLLYVVAGAGDGLDDLKRLTERLGVVDHVDFIGSPSDEELPVLYNACDVFIMPSRSEVKDGVEHGSEGFGIVYVEAAACGKPAIGTTMGGAADAVVHGETGLLVDPNSVNAIADAISTLLSDSELAMNLGDKGLNRARQSFDWSLKAYQLEALICELGD